ncbi:MAG: MFS transporter, partial [Weeksellaceae bacterium]
AKGFGIIGASFGFGFIFGPAISALTVGISPALPFIIAGVVSIIAVILTAMFLPETNQHMGLVKKAKLFDFGKLIHALTNRTVGATLMLTMFYFVAFSMFIYAFQASSIKLLDMTANQIALLFTLFGALGLVSQLILLQLATKKFGVKRTFMTALIWVAIVFIGMFFIRSIPVFVAACIALGLVNSFIQPLSQTILSEEVDQTEQGEMLGINASYLSIGQIIGPILAGLLATYSVASPYLGAGICVLICYGLSFVIFSHLDRKQQIVP